MSLEFGPLTDCSTPKLGASALQQPHFPALMHAAVHQAFNAVVITTADLTGPGPVIMYCNPAFCAMTGYAAHELMGQSPRILQGPLTDPMVIDHLRNCLQRGEFFQGSTFNYRKDGSVYLLEWNISPVRNAQGEVEAFVSVQQDVTERFQSEQRQALLARALNATEDAVVIFDKQAHIIFANHAFEKMTGYGLHALNDTSYFAPERQAQCPAFYQHLVRGCRQDQGSQSTFTNRHKNGTVFHIAQTTSPLKNQRHEVQHYVCVSKDISDLAKRTQELYTMAHRDVLTGLLNRRAGEAALDHAQRQVQQGVPHALILVDIDHFKRINDDFGHEAGDVVLQALATHVQSMLPPAAVLVRWGGEEFLLVLHQYEHTSAAMLAHRICTAVASLKVPGISRSITLSLGVAPWQTGQAAKDVLLRVDQALYSAKQRGRNRVMGIGGQALVAAEKVVV